jgi:hypothetical protein
MFFRIERDAQVCSPKEEFSGCACLRCTRDVEAQRPQVAFPESQILERLYDDLSLAEVAEVAPLKPAARTEPVRNAPCPCGSCIKYKRCCGVAPVTAQVA